MAKFKVAIHRVEHGDVEIEVEADNQEMARLEAEETSGNYEYSCCDAEYSITSVQRVRSGPPKRRMVIFMEGGLIQDIFTDFDMDVVIMDGDVEGEDEERISLIKDEDGSENSYHVSKWDVGGYPKLTELFFSQVKT